MPAVAWSYEDQNRRDSTCHGFVPKDAAAAVAVAVGAAVLECLDARDLLQSRACFFPQRVGYPVVEPVLRGIAVTRLAHVC